MKISFVRGSYLNNFEGQNYDMPITGYSSFFPIDKHVPFPVVMLPSISDFQKISLLNKPIKFIANRTIGDSQILFGLENHLIGSDIVHVADPHYYYSYQAALLKKQGQIKSLISTWWETIPFNNEGTSAKKNIKKYTMGLVDIFICHSESARNCLIEEGISTNKITVIPLGVDLDTFFPVQKIQDSFTILFVGRLVVEKGILDLYKAFKEVVKHIPSARLQIVGNGPLKEILLKMISTDNLQENVFIENKSYKYMPQTYQKADILCVPSKQATTWEEQFGMVFVEAMASGIPIVSYATGAIREIVGAGGIILQDGDIEGLAHAIERMSGDKQLRVKLGTIGRERAKNLYDCKKTKEKIVTLYKTLAP